MFYSVDFLRTPARKTASQIAPRDCSKKVGEEPEYIGVSATKTR